MIALLGCIYGILAAVIFQNFTNKAALSKASSRMLAHVLEFSLFLDEPRTIFRAQRALLASNYRLLRILALPILLTSTTFLLLYVPVNRYVARVPLPQGTTLLITQPIGTTPKLPTATVLDSPPVRIGGTQTWRVRVISSDNRLGRQPWLASFGLYSTVGAIGYAIFRIARDTPNSVKP